MEQMREHFNAIILNKMDSKRCNSGFMTKKKYDELVTKVRISKAKKTGKKPEDYQRLKRYDVVKFDGVDKLVVPLRDNSVGLRFYVYFEELFDIIHNTHLAVGHGGRNRMMKEIQGKYKNVTGEAVMIYLSVCDYCQRKSKVTRKVTLTKTMVFQEVESRCQLDIIDMTDRPDYEFQYIMVYQDDLTKFVQLRALKSDSPQEIAFHLIDIFTIFGAPSVIQSNNGREFLDRIVREAYEMWPDLKIVHGNFPEATEESTERHPSLQIIAMVDAWLEGDQTRRWSDRLRYLQLMKNKAYHDSIKCTPFEAMFGMPYKLGLKTTFPIDSINDIWTEEELKVWLERYKSVSDDVTMDGNARSANAEDLDTLEDNNASAVDPEPEIVIKQEVISDYSGEEDNDYNPTERSVGQSVIRRTSEALSLESQPNKMPRLSCGEVGDTVTIRAPRVERVFGNVQDLLAVILEIQHRQIYRLGTIHGKLTEWFTRDQFMICDEKFILIEDVPDHEISLEECVRKASLVVLPQVAHRCSCKTGCNSDFCHCKKSGRVCTRRCHDGHMCINQDM